MNAFKFIQRACFITMTGVAISTMAVPAGAQTPTRQDGWRFQLTPYVWMTGIKGSINASPAIATAHFSQSFSDVLDNLDGAAFLSGTARNGRYVLQFDASHASVSDRATLPIGLQAQAKVKQTSLSLTGGYNWELSPNDSLDLLAGIRWWDLRTNVQVSPLLDAHLDKSFVDPIVGLRWRHQFNDRWSSLLYLDGGGFGVGSHWTAQLLATVNYQVRSNIYISVGYRQLKVDYRDGTRRADIRMHGPAIGATFLF